MNSVWRLLSILACLSISIIIINKIKTSYSVPARGVKIACIPLNNNEAAADLDKKLNNYYHIAHTTHEPKGAGSFRCYFRFPTREIACVPVEVADRNQALSECTSFSQSEDRSCYFFNRKKYARLIDTLKREPAVSKESYQGQTAKTWQEARDILINLK